MRRLLAIVGIASSFALGSSVGPATAAGTWTWPAIGPIVRPYDPPSSPYGTGHRGIDIGVPAGTVAVAPAPGTVSFAGAVGGRLFVTVDHGAGLTSTLSWVGSLLVRRGDVVAAGQPLAVTGSCHPGDLEPCLHFGVRLHGVYQDPLEYLGPVEVWRFIRLAALPSA
jgi:murein DD-endopeptidase MepM/ murein hydrolase activator NlpD